MTPSESRFEAKPEGYDQGSRLEWLVANGLGGYASSTMVGANTRAYHGLLIASVRPPVERMLLLSTLDEEVGPHMLACHQYPGTIYPQGFNYLKEFKLDPFPHFSFSLPGGIGVEKTVFMVHGENTVMVHYQIKRGSGTMKIVPLVHCRSFHSASQPPAISQEPVPGGAKLSSTCTFSLLSDRARYVRQDLTYYNLQYEAERHRGLPYQENCFSPGRFEVDLSEERSFCIMASTERQSMPVADRLIKRELDRNAEAEKRLDPGIRKLALAADSFAVRRDEGKSIIAGYHWFDDWGRDTMISLPGLFLVTKRFDDARKVLTTFAGAAREGVLPNDLGAGSYNTVDAALWFIQAVHSYFRHTEDKNFIRSAWPILTGIISHYSGESQGIRMDSDGLIVSGPALTWMDARVDGSPVTPRAGKACEINALWYLSLKAMGQMAEQIGQSFEGGLADKVRSSYQKFWNLQTKCLYDVIDPEDASIRPNQVIAAAVPDLLKPEQKRGILEVVERELLTPYGLRTLSPRDPKYIGKHQGSPRLRDSAYHQGTVWPWLIGPYVTALVSANDRSEESRERARQVLMPLLDHLDIYGINTIPEVLDGDAPHVPGGCISQAWSVAEVIRAWSEDVLGLH
jgi:predicted glycogen debranching enzyme